MLLALLLCFNSCELANENSVITEVELINEKGEKIYYWILDEDTASRIDISPTVNPEEISLPALSDNESIIIDLREVDGFQLEKLHQGIYIVLYVIREEYMDFPGPIAVGSHFGNTSFDKLIRNQGRIVIKNR